MDIHGIVRTVKQKTVGILMGLWSALTLKLVWLWKTIIAYGTTLVTLIVQYIKQLMHVVIQWSIEHLHVLSLTLLVWLTKLGIIIVKPIHTAIVSLLNKIVAQHQRLVLILQKVGK